MGRGFHSHLWKWCFRWLLAAPSSPFQTWLCKVSLNYFISCLPWLFIFVPKQKTMLWTSSVYGYYSYCGLNTVGGHAPEWCHKTLPSIYAYVQDVYWDVGFLRFYKRIQRVSPKFYISKHASLLIYRNQPYKSSKSSCTIKFALGWILFLYYSGLGFCNPRQSY